MQKGRREATGVVLSEICLVVTACKIYALHVRMSTVLSRLVNVMDQHLKAPGQTLS